jgi:hypothetical protein
MDMAKQSTISITLPPTLKRWVDRQARTHRFGTTSRFVERILQLEKERSSAASKSAQHAAMERIRLGLEEARRGELLDGEVVFSELEEELAGTPQQRRKAS